MQWIRPRRAEHAAQDRRFRLQCACKSACGNYRKVNEDCCYGDSATGVFLVVDGMGGYRGGAHASRILTDIVPPYLAQATAQPDPQEEIVQSAVNQAVHAARRKMIEYADRHPDCNRMGATLALLAVAGNFAFFAHVGDSRVYLIRRDVVRRLTTDETFVQLLVRAGAISEDEARTHPKRHFVLNQLGVRPMDQPPQVIKISLEPGDWIVLTTDGVSDVVDDESLCRLVVNQCSAASAADAVIQFTTELDSRDNASCVVVAIEDVGEQVPEAVPPSLAWHPLYA